MTILDATTHLFEWFKTHDCFEEQNIKDIILVSDTPERDKAAFLCALNDLTENLVLGVTEVGERKIWVVKKALEAYDQSVDVSYPLALEIANCLNHMCDVLNDYTDQCDPRNLSTKDIMNLTFVCKTLQGGCENDPPKNSL
jgi:hypothetical protein